MKQLIAGVLVIICLYGVAVANSPTPSIAKVLFTQGPDAAYKAYMEKKEAENAKRNTPEKIEAANKAGIPLFLKYINSARAAKNLKPLVLDETLCKAAKYRAQKMADWGYLDHNIPGEGMPEDTLRKFGLRCGAGENAAAGWEETTFGQLFDNLYGSPGHRANILNPTAKRLGVGIGIDSGGGKFVVQIFTN